MVILPAICLIASVGNYEKAYAQDVSSISNITGQQVIALVVVGIIAVTLQAYQGWSTSGEKFVAKAFLDRILLGAIHSIWMSFLAAANYSTLTPITYVLIFLGVVGATELTMKQISNGSSSSSSPQPSQIPPPPGGQSGPSSSSSPKAKTIQVGDQTLTQETG